MKHQKLLSEPEADLVVIRRKSNLAVLTHHEYKALHFFIINFGHLLAVKFTLFEWVFASDGKHFDRWSALKRKLKHK